MYPNTSLILTNIPTGLPTPHKDLTPLPRPLDITTPPADPNALLTKLLYASLDPYMRGRMRPAHIKSYSPPYPLNTPITAYSVAQVVHSTHASFKPGEIIYARLPIQEYSVLAVSASPAPTTSEAGDEEQEQLWTLENIDGANSPIRKIPTPLPSGIELSQYVGILGMTGLTAYAGLFEIGEPKKGETVFVSSAAGAVGSVVGQLAKRIGCRVIGSAGGERKRRYVVEELGFDDCFDYRVEGAKEALGRLVGGEGGSGVDVYFENVGGEQLDAVLEVMNNGGRVVACGMVSQYNLKPEERYGVKNLYNVVTKRLRMRGFIVGDKDMGPKWIKERDEKVTAWLQEGSINAKEDITVGIENGPEAFVAMLRGENLGKAVLKIADPEL
ncbi:MDR family NADP-dependent oxidoreductase [Aspergillus vadensis CBS 113365]|uniref:Oxidoreductase n=1 Tax=Aspergillus vadensis (strain CBS 113365 / IMI 142717 / IBT 24658) TaxID=1448311 RepID=A0A319BI92_ASPVC|nr:oxidoreductase [Aspergillus vadensis CBS 113365]PYH71659.1 oxidoreductase [Aspergillus vadensis CBS 113365]